MKLTDFTPEQLKTYKFQRAYWEGEGYCHVRPGTGFFMFVNSDTVQTVHYLHLLADDWEIIKGKVKKKITYYVAMDYFTKEIYVYNTVRRNPVDILLDTITKEYEVEE